MTEGAAEVNDRGSEAAADDAVVDPHTASAPGADDVAPEVLAAELDAIDGDAGDAVVVVGAAEDGMVEVVVEAPVDGGLEVVIAETADGAMEVVTRGVRHAGDGAASTTRTASKARTSCSTRPPPTAATSWRASGASIVSPRLLARRVAARRTRCACTSRRSAGCRC